jgi:hypothetical protein
MNLENLSAEELIAIILQQERELDEKEREAKRIQLSQFQSFSLVAVYERFDSEATRIDTFPIFLTAPEPSADLVLRACENLKAEFPPNGLDFTDEKPIQKGFDVETPKLLLRLFGNKTTYFPMQKLARPNKTPDESWDCLEQLRLHGWKNR